MRIRRECVDAEKINFRDITAGKRIMPVHPGAILRNDFLKPMGLSIYALAKAVKVTRPLFRNHARILDQPPGPL